MLLLLLACRDSEATFGPWMVTLQEGGGWTVAHDGQEVLALDGYDQGEGGTTSSFSQGSYLSVDETPKWTAGAAWKRGRATDDAALSAVLEDVGGEPLGELSAYPNGEALTVSFRPVSDGDRLRGRFACPDDPHFLGAGSHAFDVDHAFEAFTLWVSEPGVGKVDGETPADAWFLTGTRHASSYPDPFLLVPSPPVGVTVLTGGRVDLDLCTGEAWSVVTWDDTLDLALFGGGNALEVVEAHARLAAPVLPPDWAFAAWNDAIRGSERVRAVAAALREAGAPASAIWTEDWKGAEQTAYGYHLSAEWSLDETLYPDAALLDAELEAAGFKWLAYFSPFVRRESADGEEAADLVIRDEAGDPYWFLGFTLDDTSVLDLTRADAREWAYEKMLAAVEVGFDGWMADFGEWLPTDAVLSEGDAFTQHNLYPLDWQALNQAALDGVDAVSFSRSGWIGTPGLSPVTWGGDQRTSFDADDGLPTVIPLGIGLGFSGVPLYGSDIAGYQSVGNDPSTKELWFRWCTLGAFSPIMRTHHGAYDTDNWQFDTDAETLAHYATYAREHARLFPYLRGLAEIAKTDGRPLVLHPALLFDDVPWQTIDMWMLGSGLLVAPVMTEGATGRDVTLPKGTWYSWWTGARAESGFAAATLEEIPVFVPSGTIVPVLTTIPDTFVNTAADALVTLAEVDVERTLRVFGGGGTFTEADGTRYTATGTATTAAEATGTLSSGTISAGGVDVTVEGTVARTYRIEVWP